MVFYRGYRYINDDDDYHHHHDDDDYHHHDDDDDEFRDYTIPVFSQTCHTFCVGKVALGSFC